MADQQPNFWARLKQHHIYRVAAWYGATIAVLIQVVARAFPYFGWSGAVPAVIIILIAGFPVAIVLAWLLVKPTDAASQTTWQKRRWKLGAIVTPIVIAAVVVSGIFAFRFSEQRAEHLAAERAVAGPAAAIPATSAPAMTTIIPAQSIAVLPFVNLSGDPKQVYFSDGITEEILNALAQIPDLKVAGRTSAFSFQGKNEDVRKVGAILGVATVLEGSVQKSGDKVRITAQLIDTRSGYQLWSDKYDRKATNLFAVEDDISKAITDKLQVQLAGGAGQSLVAQGTGDPRAHELYLRGMTLLAARGPGLRDAADAFRQAVTIDPKYAQAWAGLAQAEVLVHSWHYDAEGTAMQAADSAVQRALELDPNIAAAHIALCILHDERLKWADAERECRRAVQLAPGDAEALDQYAQFLHDTGNSLAALPIIERANRLDPLSGLIGGVHAMVLSDLRRCGPAKTQVDRTLAVAPDSQFARGWAMVRALDCRDYVDAEAQARRLASLIGSNPDTYAALVQGVADPAQRSRALRALGTLHAPVITIARWRVLLGDREGALAALESAVGEPGEFVPQQVWGATFDPIRDDPRFKAVMKKMGLPYTPKDLPAGTAN